MKNHRGNNKTIREWFKSARPHGTKSHQRQQQISLDLLQPINVPIRRYRKKPPIVWRVSQGDQLQYIRAPREHNTTQTYLKTQR